MERYLLLRSTAAFLLLFTAGIFCRSQGHKSGSNLYTDGGSHIRKGSGASLKVLLPGLNVFSSPGREDKTGANALLFKPQPRIQKPEAGSWLSPPDVWPTSADRAQFVPGRHSQVSSDQSHATSIEGKVRADLRRSAPHTRPTTKMDTPHQSVSLAREILVKMVSSWSVLFKRPSSDHGVQAPNFSEDNHPPADLNANSLLLASEGELSRAAKSLVPRISPAEMRPVTTTAQNNEVDMFGLGREQYKHRRVLLRDISPPGMWPITSDDDEFQVHRRRALLSHNSLHSSSETATTSGRFQKHRRAHFRDISRLGMRPITSDYDDFQVHLRRPLLSHNSPLASSATATPSSPNQNHRRALLRDISPPGMWPITSDDDEFINARRRALLSDDSSHSYSATTSVRDRHGDQKQRRALLRDISSPGMWPITSGEEFVAARKRALLSDDSPYSSSGTGSTLDRHRYHRQRRALLRDISPPGMWPITSDDDEFSAHRRRALLSDERGSTNSPSATAATTDRHQKQRRALLRDISPPGMWPISSDDDELEVALSL